MNSAMWFLLGAVALAFLLSVVVWLLSRPRKVSDDPNQLQQNLRTLRRDVSAGPPPAYLEGGIRVLGHEGSGDRRSDDQPIQDRYRPGRRPGDPGISRTP